MVDNKRKISPIRHLQNYISLIKINNILLVLRTCILLLSSFVISCFSVYTIREVFLLLISISVVSNVSYPKCESHLITGNLSFQNTTVREQYTTTTRQPLSVRAIDKAVATTKDVLITKTKCLYDNVHLKH